jgi:hypothetical protein
VVSALLWLLLADAPGRRYHTVPLEQLATTRWTHACTSGPVVYVRKMKDGDWHVTLDNGKAKVVLEIIPAIPLAPPKKGQRIEACGITRIDRHHSWPELHPVERMRVLDR